MMKQHIDNKFADYALGLLSQREQWRVEQHMMTCADCRRLLRREMELGPLVRGTLVAAAQPPTNLRPFMPAIPQPGIW